MSARASFFTRKARLSGFSASPFALFSRRHRRRIADLFVPRRPRKPLLRIALALVGLGILAFLVVLGLFVGAAMLAIGLVWRLWRRRSRPVVPAPTAAGGTIEGEYRVVPKAALASRLASVR
jgi:hypothetical protein